MKKILMLIFSALSIVLVSTAFAVSSPITMLDQMSQQVINGLEKNKTKLKQDPSLAYNLVEKYITPKVDVSRMTCAILGRQYWQQTSSSDKKELIAQLKKLVISTYSGAFSSYDGDKIKFLPLRNDYQMAQSLVVQSLILRRNGQKISVVYNLERQGDSWLIYDFSIENVSMVQSYRSQFANVLEQGGVKLLIQRLQAHNKKLPA